MNTPPLLKQPCLLIHPSLPALIHSPIRSPDAVRGDAGRSYSADEPLLVPLVSPVHAAFPRYEVIVPAVFARVEQWHHRSCNGVNARQIGAFVPITPVAGEREAGRIALSCAYRREPPCCFGTMCSTWKAIRGVASCGRPQYPYALPARARTRPRVRWSHHAARRERKRRAFACIMETMSTASTKSLYSASSAGVSVPSFALARNSSIRASRSGSAPRFSRAEVDSGVNASVKGSSKPSKQLSTTISSIRSPGDGLVQAKPAEAAQPYGDRRCRAHGRFRPV